MNLCGIYRIRHTASGNSYVGQSTNILDRFARHKSSLRKGSHHSPRLQNSWSKHGAESFSFDILELCDVTRLTEREQSWMDTTRSLFNACPAAESRRGYKYTEEQRNQLSLARKGQQTFLGHQHTLEAKAKMSAARLGNKNSEGRRHPPEVIEKIRAAHIGRKHTPESIEKMKLAWERRRTNANTDSDPSS